MDKHKKSELTELSEAAPTEPKETSPVKELTPEEIEAARLEIEAARLEEEKLAYENELARAARTQTNATVGAAAALTLAAITTVYLLPTEILECVSNVDGGYGIALVSGDLTEDSGVEINWDEAGILKHTCEKRERTVLERLDPRSISYGPPGCLMAECYNDSEIDQIGYDGKGECWSTLGAPGPDGGPRWIGCWNSGPKSAMVGPGCKPVTCTK